MTTDVTQGAGASSLRGLAAGFRREDLAALIVFGFERVQDRVAEVASADVNRLDRRHARLDIWTANLRTLRDFPVFGTGVGSHRDVYRRSSHEPIILNEGTPYEEPFGVSLAILWAERLARA